MKKILSNTISIVSQLIMLVLSGIWYYRTKEFEPLIGIIGFGSSIILGLFFKFNDKENTNLNIQNLNSANDIHIKAKQKRDNKNKTNLEDFNSRGKINIDIEQE